MFEHLFLFFHELLVFIEGSFVSMDHLSMGLVVSIIAGSFVGPVSVFLVVPA